MRRSEIYERNSRIAKYRVANPQLSLEEIGEVFGLTKQAISKILQNMKSLEEVK